MARDALFYAAGLQKKEDFTMKTTTRRILSVLLTLAMALGLFAPARAAEPLSPIVFLAGFGTELYLDDGTPEEKGMLVGALEKEELLAALGATLLDAALRPMQVLRSPNRVADALSSFVMHWLGNLACDENGDSLYPVSNASRNEAGRAGTYDGRPF